MTLTDIMDGLASLVTGLVYPYPVETVTVPCTVIGFPTEVVYDLTYADTATFRIPVWRVVGGTGIAARDAVSDALTEALSVKDALDGTHDFGAVRVTNADVSEVTIGAVTYPAVRFDTEVLA